MTDELPAHLDPIAQMEEVGYGVYADDAEQLLPADWPTRYGCTPKVMGAGLAYAILRGERTQEEIADDFGISGPSLRKAWGGLAKDFGLRGPQASQGPPNYPSQAATVDEWTPCDRRLLVTLSTEMITGPLVRVYFERYGHPDDTPGEPDEGRGPMRYYVTGRAVDYVHLTRDDNATILLDGDDGERYVVTAGWNVIEAVEVDDQRIEVSDGEQMLARQTDDGLEPVGVYPSFALAEGE